MEKDERSLDDLFLKYQSYILKYCARDEKDGRRTVRDFFQAAAWELDDDANGSNDSVKQVITQLRENAAPATILHKEIYFFAEAALRRQLYIAMKREAKRMLVDEKKVMPREDMTLPRWQDPFGVMAGRSLG